MIMLGSAYIHNSSGKEVLTQNTAKSKINGEWVESIIYMCGGNHYVRTIADFCQQCTLITDRKKIMQIVTGEGKIVTGEGQLKVGDKLTIVGKSSLDDQQTTVKEVIEINGREEIIINKKYNYYFITSLLISGKSWARQVQITNG